MEVHGLWRVDDGEVRRHGDKAGRVPRVAPLQGLPSGDARPAGGPSGAGRPSSGRSGPCPSPTASSTACSTSTVSGSRATSSCSYAAAARGWSPGTWQGRRTRGRGRPSWRRSRRRGGRHRRRERVRQGRARDLAAHQGPEVHLPRLLAGQALHDDAAEATGGARALPHRARPHGHRDAAPGGALGRALPRLVRVLGRLPGGQDRGGRQEGLHPREAEAGALVAVVAGVGGDAVHLPRPRPCQGRARCRRPTT